jgi:hypothetical protein
MWRCATLEGALTGEDVNWSPAQRQADLSGARQRRGEHGAAATSAEPSGGGLTECRRSKRPAFRRQYTALSRQARRNPPWTAKAEEWRASSGNVITVNTLAAGFACLQPTGPVTMSQGKQSDVLDVEGGGRPGTKCAWSTPAIVRSDVRRGFLCNPRLIVRRFLVEA